jgi:hypothetical protein
VASGVQIRKGEVTSVGSTATFPEALILFYWKDPDPSSHDMHKGVISA